MKRIVVLGAGFVVKPAVDYFLDRCGYEVVVTSRQRSKAERIVEGRPSGRAVVWSIEQRDKLDRLVAESDLVLSMISPSLHLSVAEACLRHRKTLVTTSYMSPAMEALEERCREADILILKEIGEDPGMDNMTVKRLIDRAKAEGGEVEAVTSYGAGLPAFEHNNNPFGYKFSWSPIGLVLAAQTPAAYLVEGRKVEVPARELFDHHWLVDLDGVGSFETYPNRDSTVYLDCLELGREVSLFRGILRYIGWCNTMRSVADLQLLDVARKRSFRSQTCAQFMATLIGEPDTAGILEKTARFLNIASNSDQMKRLQWLGLFSDKRIETAEGTNGDLLVELMTGKMSYAPFERDMVILYGDITVAFPDRKEKRSATLVAKGEPNGDTAMSKAVSIPAAIASRLILEGKIGAKGVRRPLSQEIYRPVLEEMETFGFRFADKTVKIEKS